MKTSVLSSELNGLVGKIGSVCQTMNRAAEQAGAVVEELDSKLVDADPGISVWTETLVDEQLEGGPSGAVRRIVSLGFSKVKKKKWGLCVKERLQDAQGALVEEDVSLLRKSDRQLRLLAAPHLDGLVKALLVQLEATAQQLGLDTADQPAAQATVADQSADGSILNPALDPALPEGGVGAAQL